MFSVIHSPRAEWIRSCVKPEDKIIEVGCADNPTWRGSGFNVTTCDIEKHGDFQPDFIAPAEQLPFDASTFDVVCLGELLEHVVDPKIVLQESLRILKPTGKIIITVPNEWDWSVNAKPFWNPAHVRFFDFSALDDLLREFKLKRSLTKIYYEGFAWIGAVVLNKPADERPISECIFITDDGVGEVSGGGIVTKNELLALEEMTGGRIEVVHKEMVSLDKFGLTNNPFLIDAYTSEIVDRLIKRYQFRMAHFYAGAFQQTIGVLHKANIKVSYTIAAHSRAESQKEYELLGIPYPFVHVSDDRLWGLYTRGYKEADLMICPSRKSRDVMVGMGCKNVVVIPHGVDIPHATKPFPNRFTVAYVGQPGPDKGIIYLLRAWKTLAYNDATLVIAGRGTENLLPMVRNFRNGSIYLRGFVGDINEVYSDCSVYVQPSVTEGFGIEILEAMANGRPVVASSGAGGADVVLDGKTGFIVQPKNPDEIAEKIDVIKKDYDLMVSMGISAREEAKAYGWNIVRKMYADAWRELYV